MFPRFFSFAPAGARRGQWKQTKSAVAPSTPSHSSPMLLYGYVYWENERYTN